MRQRVSFPQSTSSSTARPESRRFQDRPFAAPRSPASPARTLPTFPVRPLQPAPAVTVQRTFKKAVLDDKSRDDLWTDDETDQVYRFVLKGEDAILLARLRDGFRVWVDAETFEAVDLDDTHERARLETEKPWTEILYGDEESGGENESSDDVEMREEMRFEQIKAPVEEPPFLRPRQVGVKKEKKPSAFTARVVVQPEEDLNRMEVSDDYGAGQLEILEVRVSNERPPTRFEPLQESHTAAWTLIRAALASFKGRKLDALFDFLSHSLDDLTSDAETEQAAKKVASLARPETEYLASLRNAVLPIQIWTDVLSQMMWAYEVAYHKSAAASYSHGSPANRGEHDAMSHLREVEAALWKDESSDINKLYEKFKFKGNKKKLTDRVKRRKRMFNTLDPSPLSDIVDLIDVTFNASLPPKQYARAVRHWYELLWLAFPKVMGKAGEQVADYFLGQELPPSVARGLVEELRLRQEQEDRQNEAEKNEAEKNEDQEDSESTEENEPEVTKTGRDLIGDLQEPEYGLPKQWPKAELELSGADATSLNAHVRLNPVGDPRGGGHSGEYLLDELEIRFIRLGEERPPTRFANQRSHTVAWTLMRASVLGFSGQPLANLYEFVRHGLAQLRNDLAETWQGDADAALRDLRKVSSARLSMVKWQQRVPRMIVEYLRLHQRSRSATFNKEPQPRGHGEPFAMQVLRENEAHLSAYGGLFDPPETVIENAQVLIEVDLDHADLPWRNYANAVLHWQEALWNAFPNLMRAGGERITREMLETELPAMYGNWDKLPDKTPSGKKPATVGDLVDCLLAAQGGWNPRAHERLKTGENQETGANTDFVALDALGAGDSVFTGFALGLVGLIGEGVLDAEVVLSRFTKVPPEVIGELSGLSLRNPAHSRALQLILAPELRRIAAESLDKNRALLKPVADRCLAEIRRQLAGAGKEDKEGTDPVTAPSSPLALAIRELAAGLDTEISLETPERDKVLAERARAWVQKQGVTLYLELLRKPGTPGGEAEIAALARTFGLQAATFTGQAEDATLNPLPVDSEDSLPVLGLRQTDEGWGAVTTLGGAFNLRGEEEPGAGRQDFGAWKSELPEGVEEHLAASGGRGGTLAEGTFEAGGRQRVAWKTEGDNNCSFNGMALVLMGLVAQGRLAPADLAARLSVDEKEVEALVDAAKRMQADAASALAIQKKLSGPLRHLAVKALGERKDLQQSMADEFLEELRGHIYSKFGLKWRRISDLFAGSSPLKPAIDNLREEGEAALAELCADKKAEEKEKLIDAWLLKETGRVFGWFFEKGVELYLADMDKDQVWGGMPELQALAAALGVHVTVFRDVGGVVSPDEGVASAGWAPADGLEDAEVQVLRHLELIEGKAVSKENPRIFFKRLSRQQAVEKLAGKEALAEKFLALYDAHYAFRGKEPIEIGMFRHRNRAHWSAVSTGKGAYDLNDPEDRLEGRMIPSRRVDSEESTGAWSRPLPGDGWGSTSSGGRWTGRGSGPTEGAFEAGGRRHTVWKTVGDNNCSFNGMALVLMGLVAQERLAAAELAERLKVDAKLIESLTEAAGQMQGSTLAARKIQTALTGPLRTRAVSALRERLDLQRSMADELLEEVRGHIYSTFGVKWVRISDLFARNSPLTPAIEECRSKGEAALAEECAGKNAEEKEKLIDAWLQDQAGGILAWFLDEGIELYLADMDKDQVWGGMPELQALAAALGVHVTIFRDVGGLVSPDEGLASAGTAPLGDLSLEEVATLRQLELIEGKALSEDDPRIFFKRLTRDQVEQKLAGQPELARKFLALYDEHYAFRGGKAPIEVGMFRHRNRAHWSAVSTEKGAYDLNDPEDRLKGVSAPGGRVDDEEDVPSWPRDFAWDEERIGQGGGNGGRRGMLKVNFKRVPLNVPGVRTVYSDHMFGKKQGGFDLTKIDGTLGPSNRVGLVNAANTSLRGGGGIDGAIHHEEGTEPISGRHYRDLDVDAWEKLHNRKGIQVGEAMTTSGGNLRKRGIHGVIHTVGPQLGQQKPMDKLRQCARSVLDEAQANNLDVVIFCNISSAIFGLPPEETAETIRQEAEAVLQAPPVAWKGWMPSAIAFNNFPQDKSSFQGSKRGRDDDDDDQDDKDDKDHKRGKPDPDGESGEGEQDKDIDMNDNGEGAREGQSDGSSTGHRDKRQKQDHDPSPPTDEGLEDGLDGGDIVIKDGGDDLGGIVVGPPKKRRKKQDDASSDTGGVSDDEERLERRRKKPPSKWL